MNIKQATERVFTVHAELFARLARDERAMTKGELNIAAAELQQKVNRIDQTFERALLTARLSVIRKYQRQVTELLDSKITNSTDGESQEFLYPREVVNRVEFPEWHVLAVHDDMKNDTIEDLDDNEVVELTEGQKTGVWVETRTAESLDAAKDGSPFG